MGVNLIPAHRAFDLKTFNFPEAEDQPNDKKNWTEGSVLETLRVCRSAGCTGPCDRE